MEPLSAFLSLISMLRIFKQERSEQKKSDRQAFMDWLDYHKHEELKSFIANTAAVRAEVDQILTADHALMIQKLDGIQEAVAMLLSRVDEFRGLSLAVAPDAQLSEQALSILRQFGDSGADILFYGNYGGTHVLQSPDCEPLIVTEPRFVKSDMDQLTALGLLSPGYGSNGDLKYGWTRNASRYLQAVGAKTSATG